MKAGIFYGPHDIRVEEVADPKIQNPKDAIVKITYTCICGSDLWWYRGITKRDAGGQIGHEFMGEVLAIGNDVKNVKIGDLVVGPFFWCDGTCAECKKKMSSACLNGGSWGTKGTTGCQAEQLRVPYADANLFTIPKDTDEKLMPAILALSDVMGTGHHAAISAGVTKDSVIAVVGDGAVGLCAVLASKRLRASKIILMSRHEKNAVVGKQFGATDIIAERDQEGIEKVKALTEEIGADCVLECVGGKEARDMAMGMVRPGGRIGCVGIPHNVTDIPTGDIFWKNITIGGGIAPTATYIPQLLPDVLSAKIDPSPVFNLTLPLADLAKGYEAMDKREAIKVLIRL
ncbi:MAG TPA: zinc-dependent alcohol dehydrogenase family protein [Patescibacteria group bacterium]|nr:zinc-dependent alcohol dehydrogenase family protein [Patescibacteria group bacterium]